MKKYVLTEETKEWNGATLYRIRAVRDIPEIGVKAGDLGGWIASEKNLDQDGNAWVSGDAWVYGNAWVYGDARVSGDAWVYGNARVYGDAVIDSSEKIFWASSVGSERDTLTAYLTQDGDIEVTRGCFRGTLDEFEKAVRSRHSGTRYEEEYLGLIEFIRLRFRDVVKPK